MARKTGIFAGIMAFILAFIHEIPIFPPGNFLLNFHIFTLDNVYYYYWGYVINGTTGYSSIALLPIENLFALLIWLMIFLIGLISIMASTTKARFSNSIKLYKISILLILLLLSIFGIIIIFSILEELLVDIFVFLNVFGLGYYMLIIILILNIIALKKLKKLAEG